MEERPKDEDPRRGDPAAEPEGEPAIPEPPPLPESGVRRVAERIGKLLIGPARALSDPSLFHKISLAAFLAWVGLGADGLSSSAYGPEAAFLALHEHAFLAIPLAGAVGLAILVIATSYIRVIERFPAGGGGYVVATKLLGPGAGLVSGCALLVDYVLTVAISLAACAESLFSLLPPSFHPLFLPSTLALLAVLTILNLRGVRESVAVISPIFLLFVVSHVAVLIFGIVFAWNQVPREIAFLQNQSASSVQSIGWLGLLMILFRAFTLGGGTFTGIEAVSNGVPMLREPRVETAKATMRYMAVSLALIASGILVNYLLYQVQPVPGKTLNAVLWQAITGSVFGPTSRVSEVAVAVILVAEGALLFVAAQTGFLGGPRVMVYMGFDRWVPSRFGNLSERLVTANGVLFIAVSSAVVLLATQGRVHLLVVLYSINVFLTFALAQLGMIRDGLHLRRERKPWVGPLTISSLGFAVTGSLLVGTVAFKFTEGGWATLLTTGVLCLVGLAIRRHYRRTTESLQRLDESLTTVPLPAEERPVAPMAKRARTAVLTVTNFGGLGVHTLLNLFRMFPGQFQQVVFVSVGMVDSGRFKGVDELAALRANTETELGKYVAFARRLGVPAECRYALGTDIVDELESICEEVREAYPRSVVFGGQLVFRRENAATRWLHNQTCAALQRRLAFHGAPMVILPVRVY